MVGTLVAEKQRPRNVALDGRAVRGQREEEFMEPPDMLPGFDGTILTQILRQGQHQRLALVKHIDLLPLTLGKPVALGYAEYRHHGTQPQEHQREDPDLLKARLNIFQ